MGSLLSGMSSFGPESSIGAMKGAVQKVEYAGSSTVGGDQVDRYHVTVDSTALAQTLGAGASGDLPKTVTYDLYVDHDHLTGKLRDLLCHHCNLLLGNAQDSVERLRLAIAYLQRHSV